MASVKPPVANLSQETKVIWEFCTALVLGGQLAVFPLTQVISLTIIKVRTLTMKNLIHFNG